MNQRERHPIHGVLNNIRSLYNVGAIFRISDGALIPIPRYGLKQSLHVAVAYGIAIYELVYRHSQGLDREEAEPPGGRPLTLHH